MSRTVRSGLGEGVGVICVDRPAVSRRVAAVVVAVVALAVTGLVSEADVAAGMAAHRVPGSHARVSAHASVTRLTPGYRPRVLPAVHLSAQAGRMPRPLVGLPDGSVLLDHGRVQALPDVPGAISTTHLRNNNHGQTVGNYVDALDANGMATGLHGGRVIGGFGDQQGAIHPWLWEHGNFTDLAPPGALLAAANEINARGQIVGVELDARPKLVSFLYKGGRCTPIELPGRCDTAAYGLNDRGQITIAAVGTTDGSTCQSQGVNS